MSMEPTEPTIVNRPARIGLPALLVLLALALPAESADWTSELGSPDASVRAAARLRAIEVGPDAVPALAELLREGSVVAAAEAVAALAEIGTSEAREALHRALAEASHPIRRVTAKTLGRVGDFRDVDALAGAITTTPLAACHALGSIGHRLGIPPLVRALEAGLESGGRVEALAALVRLGVVGRMDELLSEIDQSEGRRALVRLREITGVDAGSDAKSWGDWWRREVFARAFDGADPDAADARIAAVLEAEDPTAHVDDFLILMTSDERTLRVRCQAARVLGLLGDRRAVDSLLAAYQIGQPARLRLYAVEALGRIGDPRAAVPIAFQVGLSDPDRVAAQQLSAADSPPYELIDPAACVALTRMGLKGGLRMAIERLFGNWRIRMYHESLLLLRATTGREFDFRPDQANQHKREAALRWYTWFLAEREKIELPTVFDTTDENFRRDAGKLIDRLNHFKMLYTMQARSALKVLGEPVIPMLDAAIRARADGEEQKRRFACEVLGEIGVSSCVPPLVHALESDPDRSVRVIAANALSGMGLRAQLGGAALRALVRDAKSPPDVLLAAVEALGNVSDDPLDADDVESAMMRFGEPAKLSPEIRLVRGCALGRLRRAAGLDDLVSLLDASSVLMRRSAVEALREVTGHEFGYVPDDADAESRAAAAGRWKARVAKDRSTLPRGSRGYVKVTTITAP